MRYTGRINRDEGLTWGAMWMLDASYPERQHPGHHHAASVRRVLVARRRVSGADSKRGLVVYLFVREPGRDYAADEYLERGHSWESKPGRYQRFFLTEQDAWAAYVDRMQRHLDRLTELVTIGRQMLAEAEGIMRLKSR